MIARGDKETALIYVGTRVVSAVYKGATEIWTALKNYWYNLDPWRNDAPWTE